MRSDRLYSHEDGPMLSESGRDDEDSEKKIDEWPDDLAMMQSSLTLPHSSSTAAIHSALSAMDTEFSFQADPFTSTPPLPLPELNHSPLNLESKSDHKNTTKKKRKRSQSKS